MPKVLEIGVKTDTSGSIKSLADLEKQSKKTFDTMQKGASKAGKQTSQHLDKGRKSTKSFTDTLGAGAPQMGRFGGFIGKIGSGMKTMNPLLMAGALAVGVFVGSVTAGVKEFKTFEKTMSNAKALIRPTATEFERLSAEARKLGMSTAFTADQAGQAFTELGKLGFEANEIIAASADVLNLAAAANSDMATAALATAKTLNQFNLEADEAGRVTDVIALASASSALDIYSFSESMKIAGATSKGFGVSLEESTAVISAMSSAGLEGTMAGTGFSRMLVEMGREGSKSNKLIKQLGLENATFTEKIQGLNEAGLDAGQTIETFGLLAGKSALAIINNADEVARLGSEYQNAGGAAQNMADVQLDNLDGSLKLLKSAFSEVKLKIGEAFAPHVRSGVDLLTEALSALNFVMSAKDQEQQVIQLTARSNEVARQKKLVDSLTKAEAEKTKVIRRSWMTEGQWASAKEAADATEIANKKELQKEQKRLNELVKWMREEAGISPKGKKKKSTAEEAEAAAQRKRDKAEALLKKEAAEREAEQLRKARVQSLDKWNLYQLNALQDTLDTRLQKIELQKEKELRLLSEDVAAGKITVEKSETVKKSIEETAVKKSDTAKESEAARLKKELDEQKSLLIEFNGFKVGLIEAGIDKESAALDKKYNEQEDKLRGYLDKKLITEEEFASLESELEAAKIAEKEELEDQYLMKRAEKFNSHFQMVGGLSQDLMRGSFSFANATDAARLKKMKDANKKELKNKSLTDSQKQKLSEKFDAEEEQLERKIFERKKKQSIANALIQGALAIANIWGEWAWNPAAAIPLTVLAGTMTGLNVGAIASQQFEDGGVVGGFQGATKGRDTTLVSARPGEMYFNARQQRRLFNAVDSGQLGGNSSPTLNYTAGSITFTSDKVTDEDIDRIRETQDEDFFKFREMYETLKASGEL